MGGSDLVQEGTKNDLGKGESEPQNVPSGMDSDSGSEECLSPVSNVQIGSGGGDVEDDEVGRTGWITASLLIVNAALGAGLLNFPSAFNQAGGVAVGISVQLLLMLFIVPAILVLVYTSDFNRAKTLQEVLAFTSGKGGEVFTSVFIAIYCFNTTLTFLVIIGDQFDRVFATLAGPTFCHFWYMNRNFTICATSTVLIFPFCFPKRIDFLRHASSVGVVAVFYVVFLIIAQYFKGNYIPGPIKTAPGVWTDLFMVIPAICFSYQCHVSIVPIYSCMKHRSLSYLLRAAVLAVAILFFTYSVAASFGYLTFGRNVQSDVLESYDAADPSVLIAIVAIAIKTYTTYPIMLFCGREAISSLWVDLSLSMGRTGPEEKYRRMTIATIWFACSLLLAVVLPNIDSIIKINGSLATLYIFFFPGVCLVRLSDIKDSSLLFSLGSTLLIIGAFIFGVVATQAITFLMADDDETKIPLCIPQF